MVLLVATARLANAQVAAAGTTDAVVNGSLHHSGVNAAITGDATTGNLWFASEYEDRNLAATPAVDLVRYQLSPATVFVKSVAAIGDLTGDGHYPTITTWPGVAKPVIVVSKEDLLQAEAHLRVTEQPRLDFTLAATVSAVTPANTGYEHSKPNLAHDVTTNEEYLCWTRKNAGVEDVWSKPNDAATWLLSTDRPVSQTADTEDHCIQGFAPDGTRYSVYHRDTATDDVWLELTRWTGGVWTTVAEFALQGSADANFPTVFVRKATATTAEVYVAASHGGGQDILFWDCGPGNVAACDSATELGASVVAVSGGGGSITLLDPKVFAAPRGALVDVFIAYQFTSNQVNGATKVFLQSKCSGAAWVLEGFLPWPTGVTPNKSHLGTQATSTNPSVHWDGTEFHIAFLADDNLGVGNFDLLRYHATSAQLCP